MKNPKKAKEHLNKIRKIVAENPIPIFKMSKEDVIKKLRITLSHLVGGLGLYKSNNQ